MMPPRGIRPGCERAGNSSLFWARVSGALLLALFFIAPTPAAAGHGVAGHGGRSPDAKPPAGPSWDAFYAPGGWYLSLASAQLFGVGNVLDYYLAPQHLRLRWQPFEIAQWGSYHVAFPVRIEGEALAVLIGPEHLWVGGSLGCDMVLWRPGSRWAYWANIGVGAGAIDSQGVPHGQGQDLTFTYMGSTGISYQLSDRTAISLGFFFEHLSNANLSEPERPNVGLDAIGPGVEFHWKF